MKTQFQVLSAEECHRVHDETLKILEQTGVRVETQKGREILKQAGAGVNDHTKIVKFPRNLVESALAMMPRVFTLGARRPGAGLVMNGDNCTLCLDGDGTMVLDGKTGVRRPATYADWKNITRLADALDEIGVYWLQVGPSDRGDTLGASVDYMCRVFRNFSKHIQDTIGSPDEAKWYTEILQTIFGSRQEIQETHPVSYLLCPQSPLLIDDTYTDAYLALKGWNIPVAIMPMPLMGATAPGTLVSTIVQGNCEVLSMICLLQAHEPGLPILYAPALAVMNPKTGMLNDASMEYSLMGAAATEMARYYGIPAESSPGGSNAHILDIQNGYEGGVMTLPTILAWPDILVGPGMLDGSMVASLEQIIIDVEIFRLAQHAHRGIAASEDKWLTDVIHSVGPGGNYLSEESTVRSIRSKEWYISSFGSHDTFEGWEAGGKKDLREAAREKVDEMLAAHIPLPLSEDVEKELEQICRRARENS